MNHALEAYRGTCGRCGATRHDQGLGDETVPDCLGWTTGHPCGSCWCCRLVAVFREVKRVLRPDGCCFINVGDAFASAWACPRRNVIGNGSLANGKRAARPDRTGNGLKEKDLCMLPARLALALQADGWWLRSEIVWAKKNPMPESCRDRPTRAHEMVYLLTKRPTYFFDAYAIRESAVTAEAGRQCRSVWPLASEPTPFHHFATMPSALVRRCLLASCSAGGVCAACGTPARRLVERTFDGEVNHREAARQQERCGGLITGGTARVTLGRTGDVHTTTTGFAPACPCNAGVVPPTVIDPFMGSGTTLVTARDLFIKSIGVELNPIYCALAASRLTQGVLALAPGVC